MATGELNLEELLKESGIDRTSLPTEMNVVLEAIRSHILEQDEKYRELEKDYENAVKREFVDGLTGLQRHELLYPLLEFELGAAVREKGKVSILALDVDNFKKYNDTNGHIQGDKALETIGAIIKGSIRVGDVPIRGGGEEFYVILPATDEDGANRVAETIRKNIEETQIPKAVSGAKLEEGYKTITVSIGGFTYKSGLDAVLGFLDENREDKSLHGKVKTILHIADGALYDSKKEGKNIYTVARVE